MVLLIALAIPAGLARGDEPNAAGHTLELCVVERDGGKPIAGVTIRARENRGPNTPTSRGTTDQHGACSVPVPPGSSLLPAPAKAAPGEEPEPPTVWPGSFPPDFRQLAKAGSSNPPLVIRLGPGRTIRGRVVTPDGRPVARARITPEIHGRTDLSALRAETDADGQFEWKHAPTAMEVLKVEYPAEGQEVRRSAPGAGVTEIVLTMPRPFRLRGKVVDAETGRPIERCRLIEGVAHTYDFSPTEYESPPAWSRLASSTIEGGHYEVRFPHEKTRGQPQFYYPVLLVRVEAEGYAPMVSRVFRNFESQPTFDFALRRRP